jgi:hypothetical protein
MLSTNKERGTSNMAIDLAKIRARMAQLSGQKKTSSVQLWKPGPGEYKIRVIPWKNAPEGEPFIDRWFYYIGNNFGTPTLKQFGKDDPIDKFIHKLFKSGDTNDRELAKKLMPKMYSYAAVVVRGEEDKNVQVWKFPKTVYQRLLSFFVNPEIGDMWMDPEQGYDLIVVVTESPKKFPNQKKPFMDFQIDASRKPSRLSPDSKQAQAWLDGVPNVDDMNEVKSKEELEAMLNTWMNSAPSPEQNAEAGTSRGPAAAADALDNLVNEVRGSAPKAPEPEKEEAQAKPARKPAARRPSVDDDAPATTGKKSSLDDAFEDLMNKED